MPKLLEFQRKGVIVPDLEKMPVLRPHLNIVWRAYVEIANREQGVTMSGITTWLDLHETYDKEERRWFFKMLSAIDDARLAKEQEKNNG